MVCCLFSWETSHNYIFTSLLVVLDNVLKLINCILLPDFSASLCELPLNISQSAFSSFYIHVNSS